MRVPHGCPACGGVRCPPPSPIKDADGEEVKPSRAMTQLTDATPMARNNDLRIIPLVCSAHFVSHFYILVLPPLFPFIREFYGVSYTELGFALTAFNVTTALCQTPAGFLVDRVGPRLVLIAGLVLGAACLVVVGARSVVLADGRDVRPARHRERRLSPGRLCDPLAARLAPARRPGIFAPHLCGLSRHGGCAGLHVAAATRVRLAGRVSRRLGAWTSRGVVDAAAAGGAVRAATKACKEGRGAGGQRPARLAAAALWADPPEPALLRR